MADTQIKRAVIYARVSSQAQVRRGHGLDSQETRCREYARFRNYGIEKVFTDSMTGGVMNRPGMVAMLDYLKKHRREARYVVLIDDISRLARDIRTHFDLRDALQKVDADLESPAMEFGQGADGRFFEGSLALGAQYQREKNKEQVIARMRARVTNGYYVFAPVVGYRYGVVDGHGKMLVPDEPNASIVRDALNGFASGRFQTVTEVV